MTHTMTSDARMSDDTVANTSGSTGLARTFVDLLIADAGRKFLIPPMEDGDTSEDWAGIEDSSELPLPDSAPSDETEVPLPTVPEAAAAILLAGAFDRSPHVLLALRSADPVVVLENSGDLHKPIVKIVSICVFGRETDILVPRRYSLFPERRDERPAAAILCCDVERRERDAFDRDLDAALVQAVPVLLLEGSGPDAYVPELLRSSVDHRLALGEWTAEGIAILIEAVTGSPVEVCAADWIGKVTLADLRAAVSPKRGAQKSLERLRAIVGRQEIRPAGLPSLRDLSGYGTARTVGLSLIEDLAAYREGRIGWDELDRGLLLVGPPGVGKTFFARVFAESAGVPVVIASLAAWQASGGGYLGDCLKAMAASFREARANAPSVLFIDELDSIGDRSDFGRQHRSYSTQVVNALLTHLDGAADRAGVIVVAATNRLSSIDPAVVRSGRIDRVVHIPLPSPRELAGILRTCLGPLLADEDLLPVALAGVGGSGADAASWVRRARGFARRAGRDLILDDLMTAVRDGRLAMTAETRYRIAAHEAGHAVASVALGLGGEDALTLHDGGGTALGKGTDAVFTKDLALRRIVHTLAGRASEIIATGSASSGAGGSEDSDLALATTIAVGIEASWGLGDAGVSYLGDPLAVRTAMSIRGCPASISAMLHHAEREADRLIRENAAAVERCARLLLATGYLEAAEIAEVVGEVPPFRLSAPARGTAGNRADGFGGRPTDTLS